MVNEKAKSEGFYSLCFVDLGCGDFRIGKQLLPLCTKYIGADIVKSLIDYNINNYSNENISFVHLDIVDAELPLGDVCFIRQVFQHLSNRQILSILKKIENYKWVFITEHYPTNNESIVPNLEKVHGADIRAYKNSGVYLTQAPFNIPIQKIEMVLEVPGDGLGNGFDQGVIRTFLYKPL